MQSIQTILNAYIDPYLQKTWGEVSAIQSYYLSSHTLHVSVRLGYPVLGLTDFFTTALEEAFSTLPEIKKIKLQLIANIIPHSTQPGVPALSQVKNVIAIGSGKGGVGKSTIAINLAIALLQQGAKVGLLDADISGPNQAHMLGQNYRLIPTENQKLFPVMVHGLQTISMAYLLDPHMPMIWRGPMISRALQQLACDTAWQQLDYLIVDLPPGTGDIQLTLAQKIPVSAAIIVTTPQDVALLDARKGLEMFLKVNLPIMGIIENMSTYSCTACGHHEAIFGEGGAKRLSEATHTELLGQIPLATTIREQADKGNPIVAAFPQSEIATCYQEVARGIAAKLALQPKNYAALFPKILVEKSP